MVGTVKSAVTGSRQRRVLLVEDDPGVTSMLTVAIRFLDLEIHTARSGDEALRLVEKWRPHVILLDVVLPGIDGFEICSRLRGSGILTPVLFLSARESVEDKIRGLALGGDDYVTKPFDMRELIARVQALIRRAGDARVGARRLRAGSVELDQDSHEVWRDGRAVRLSATEYALLKYLMEHAGRVISKARLLEALWGYGSQGDMGLVETYVYYVRRKLGDAEQSLIRTVRGTGYLLQDTPWAEES